MGLKGLVSSLEDIKNYLEKVVNQQMPINHQIIYQLQDVFNLLPDINLTPFVKAVYVKTNDQMLVVYLASLIRCIIALHNLISNKLFNRDAEKNGGKEKEEKKKKALEESKKKKEEEKAGGDAKDAKESEKSSK